MGGGGWRRNAVYCPPPYGSPMRPEMKARREDEGTVGRCDKEGWRSDAV
jgi:hypothetical protein